MPIIDVKNIQKNIKMEIQQFLLIKQLHFQLKRDN